MKIVRIFNAYLLHRAMVRVANNLSENLIKELIPIEWIKKVYRKFVRESFTITEKIVNVKKGKRRYTLLFVEHPGGKIRYNLGRHR